MIGGLLLIAAGLVVAAQATSLWQIYLGYGLGVGVGVGLSYVPSVAAVQRWFVRRRGTASGLAVAGIGVGTLIGAPLAHELIADFGWRQTYLVLAALTAVGALVAGCAGAPRARALRPRPRRRSAASQRRQRHADRARLGEAMRSARSGRSMSAPC